MMMSLMINNVITESRYEGRINLYHDNMKQTISNDKSSFWVKKFLSFNLGYPFDGGHLHYYQSTIETVGSRVS